MHSDPNADQLAFEVDGAPTPNESSAPSTSAVTEPSTPPSSSANALDTLLNEYRARATSEREKGTLFEELTRQFLLHDASGRGAAPVTQASTWLRSPTSKTPAPSRFSASSTHRAIRSAKQISTPSYLLQARSLSLAASLSILLAPTGARTPKTRSRASRSQSRVSPWRICAIRTSTGARIHWAHCRRPRPASARSLEITRYARAVL